MRKMKKNIDLLIFDGDGTLWNYQNSCFGSSWDALSEALGIKEETDKLMQQYYGKTHLNGEWVRKQVNMFKGGDVKLAEDRLYPIPTGEDTKPNKHKLLYKLFFSYLCFTFLK